MVYIVKNVSIMYFCVYLQYMHGYVLYMHICRHVYICMRVWTYGYIYVYMGVYMYIVCVGLCIGICGGRYVYVYTHTCRYICIYVYVSYICGCMSVGHLV